VRVERGAAPPTDAFDAPDLPTARALLATLDLADFNPTAAAWQPATAETLPVGASWRDDSAGRSLLHAL
jgi:hypothetical protein